MTVSRSGQTRSPYSVMSSPVLPTTVISAPGRRGPGGEQAAQESRGSDAAGGDDDPAAAEELGELQAASGSLADRRATRRNGVVRFG